MLSPEIRNFASSYFFCSFEIRCQKSDSVLEANFCALGGVTVLHKPAAIDPTISDPINYMRRKFEEFHEKYKSCPLRLSDFFTEENFKSAAGDKVMESWYNLYRETYDHFLRT